MPVSRRFFPLLWARRIFFISSAVLIGALVVWLMRSDSTPTYKLTNASLASTDGIARNQDNTGTRLPTVVLTTVRGESISTESFLGSPVIINIWYSTCEPCRRELPVLGDAYRRYGEQVRFVGININDGASVAQNFARNHGADFELFLDTNGLFVSAAGIATAPVTLAVSQEGVIIDQVAGELSASRLDELVAELLG